ncbi:MAG: NAD(P) transhydrogenase subunit alpha [Gammaproteobacteria bacterium]|nr:NAD(P) transhydrogenase subunit alpha [Gammaproteobacteria bacterium]
MTVFAVPLERANDEKRVALVPGVVERLIKDHQLTVQVEQGAGAEASYTDAAYEKSGASIVDSQNLYKNADVVLRVSPPSAAELRLQRPGSIVAGFLGRCEGERLDALRAGKLTALAMESMPRTTRAQAMDALSSQRSAAGYHAVVAAATRFDRFLPMLTGPTGTVRPATVLIIGAGVAGLQAAATARRLGAVVEVSDIRAASREQVESIGARFVGAKIDAEASGGYARELTAEEKQAQAELLAKHVAGASVLLTTAEIPGRPAPRIVTTAMLEAMKPGAVVIDLAASSGGNCELTQVGQTIRHNGISIWGPHNMAACIPAQASDLYAQNLRHFIALLVKDGQLQLDWQDEILTAVCVMREGKEPVANDKPTKAPAAGKDESAKAPAAG